MRSKQTGNQSHLEVAVQADNSGRAKRKGEAVAEREPVPELKHGETCSYKTRAISLLHGKRRTCVKRSMPTMAGTSL